MTDSEAHDRGILTPEQQARLQRQRELIAEELPELLVQSELLHEAMQENTFSGQLRRAIHHSGRPVTRVAAEAGLTARQLTDFLTGERTLRSDALDRLVAAVGGQLVSAGSAGT
ncbi:MAG: hypothetical protein ACLQNE_15875 [Thermoguttaceae bacterium]|jgi:hypothetical protein